LFQDVETAKRQDRVNWKKIVKSVPPHLPKELCESISLIYQSYANELTKRKWFDAPDMRKILNRIKELI
jgi:hypothetical protein